MNTKRISEHCSRILSQSACSDLCNGHVPIPINTITSTKVRHWGGVNGGETKWENVVINKSP